MKTENQKQIKLIDKLQHKNNFYQKYIKDLEAYQIKLENAMNEAEQSDKKNFSYNDRKKLGVKSNIDILLVEDEIVTNVINFFSSIIIACGGFWLTFSLTTPGSIRIILILFFSLLPLMLATANTNFTTKLYTKLASMKTEKYIKMIKNKSKKNIKRLEKNHQLLDENRKRLDEVDINIYSDNLSTVTQLQKSNHPNLEPSNSKPKTSEQEPQDFETYKNFTEIWTVLSEEEKIQYVIENIITSKINSSENKVFQKKINS